MVEQVAEIEKSAEVSHVPLVMTRALLGWASVKCFTLSGSAHTGGGRN